VLDDAAVAVDTTGAVSPAATWWAGLRQRATSVLHHVGPRPAGRPSPAAGDPT
jgi:hypothetical protein